MGKNTSILILCGGKGTRLDSRTRSIPKALVPVNGKPMLAYIFDHFVQQGFTDLVCATGYLSDSIREFTTENYSELKIGISDAGVEAGMLKRISEAQAHLKSDDVILAYGDTFIQIDYEDLLRVHREQGRLMTLVTGKIQNPFGIVTLEEGNRIRTFQEKPVFDHYIGCLVFKKKLLNGLPQDLIQKADGSGLVGLFQLLAREGELQAYRHEGLQITFNTEHELQSAQELLAKYHTLDDQIPEEKL